MNFGNLKIKLPQEETGFKIVPVSFCNVESLLVIPSTETEWTEDNLHFRSLIVSKETNEILSCGFKKFFNHGEKPDLYPDVLKFNDVFVEEKQDGSLMIVDYVNNTLSLRTRGSSTYKSQENWKDFEMFVEEYDSVVQWLKNNSHLSLLFEIETPNNTIIIRSEQIKFTFLGAVDKKTLKMISREQIVDIADCHCLSVPKQYPFNTLEEVCNVVQKWIGQEGVVLSYNNNQNRIKLKSLWYLTLHKIKSHLNNDNALIDFYVDKELPTFEQFYNAIETEFDFEIASQLKTQIEKISIAGEQVKQHIEKIKEFVNEIRNFPTRKEIAKAIIQNKKDDSALAFAVLDNKQITDKQYFDLIKSKL